MNVFETSRLFGNKIILKHVQYTTQPPRLYVGGLQPIGYWRTSANNGRHPLGPYEFAGRYWRVRGRPARRQIDAVGEESAIPDDDRNDANGRTINHTWHTAADTCLRRTRRTIERCTFPSDWQPSGNQHKQAARWRPSRLVLSIDIVVCIYMMSMVLSLKIRARSVETSDRDRTRPEATNVGQASGWRPLLYARTRNPGIETSDRFNIGRIVFQYFVNNYESADDFSVVLYFISYFKTNRITWNALFSLSFRRRFSLS